MSRLEIILFNINKGERVTRVYPVKVSKAKVLIGKREKSPEHGLASVLLTLNNLSWDHLN